MNNFRDPRRCDHLGARHAWRCVYDERAPHSHVGITPDQCALLGVLGNAVVVLLSVLALTKRPWAPSIYAMNVTRRGTVVANAAHSSVRGKDNSKALLSAAG